jgi:hypothetical protein
MVDVIVDRGRGRELVRMRWGLVPPWTKPDEKDPTKPGASTPQLILQNALAMLTEPRLAVVRLWISLQCYVIMRPVGVNHDGLFGKGANACDAS